MGSAPLDSILHVTALHGGGVDRHVRSIARSVARAQVAWHAGESADVVEDFTTARVHPLDPRRRDDTARALAGHRVEAIHLHATSRAARDAARRASAATGAPLLVTLHDVLFLREDGFDHGDPLRPDPRWVAEVGADLRAARAVIAPSDFVARIARQAFPGLAVDVIPNGSPPLPHRAIAPRAAFAAHAPRHVVAVMGAIGPHKGSEVLEALPALLAGTDIGIVAIGYLDRQLFPGWRVPGRLFIHGAYDDADVPGLYAAYGAKLALFPNRVPESFSYALSDTWASGIPVLATAQGALAERIERHGGGWLLPAEATPDAIAAELRRLLEGDGTAEIASVQSTLARPDIARIPSLDAMARTLDALYTRFAIDPASPAGDPASLEKLVRVNLDGALFRQELVRLSDEYAQLAAALDGERERGEKDRAEAREWIAKLENDLRVLTADVQREVEERRRLGQEIVPLQIHKDAFDRLPGLVRRYLLKKTLDARD